MKSEVRDWTETETETERTVTYKTQKAHVTVHIPKRSEAEQAEYERNVRTELRRFYHAITSKGYDWDELVAKNDMCI